MSLFLSLKLQIAVYAAVDSQASPIPFRSTDCFW